MDHMRIHFVIDFVKIVERNHGVAVVFCMIVGIPKQDANEKIRSYRSGIQQAVWLLGDFTVSVFQVSNIVNNWVTSQDRTDPPKEEICSAFRCSSKSRGNHNPMKNLNDGSSLQSLHDATLIAVGPILEAPSSSTVVNRNAEGREKDSA